MIYDAPIDTQKEIPLELINDQKKKDSGPLPLRKIIARWGLVFIIFYALFFVLLVKYKDSFRIPKAVGDISVEKLDYSFFLPIGSTLIVTISTLLIIELFKRQTLKS